MSRFFLDTNILLDVAIPTRVNSEASRSFLSKALAEGHDLAVLASSLKDFYYIYQRATKDEATAREMVRSFRAMLTLVDLDASLVDDALDSNEPDFEDGLIRAAAERLGAGLLVTHDKKAFDGTSVQAVMAMEAELLLSSEGKQRDKV